MGVAAAKQALADSGLVVDDGNRDDIGVIFGSGGGGPLLLMDNLENWHNKRRANGFAVLHRQHAARHGVGPDRHRDRHPRLEHVHRHRLLDRHAQHRRGGRGHPSRRLHRGADRRDREPAARDGPHRLLEHARHGPAAAGRGARDRFAAVRQDAQRLRPRRGLGRDDARGPRVRQGTWREGLCRGRRLRLSGRRVGPDPAGREGRRRATRDAPGARAPQRAGQRDRPDQPARDVHAAGRPARGAGDLVDCSATTRRTSPSRRPSR